MKNPKRPPNLCTLGLRVGAGFLALCSVASGFPPAPGFTVFGIVRDPFGRVVDSPSAKIIFKDTVTGNEIVRSTIGGGKLDENYRIMLPIDLDRSGEAYKPGAIAEATPFSIEILIDGTTYLPIETVITPLDSATTADFLRLDLDLGADADRDGLPDLWEQWQLEGAGLPVGDIARVGRDDDPDGDGLTNYEEYIAGTFAYLSSDRLDLKVKSRGSDGWNTLEFLAVVDKTYLIEETADFVTWKATEFTVTGDRSDLTTDLKATDTTIVTLETEAPSDSLIYRLTVR